MQCIFIPRITTKFNKPGYGQKERKGKMKDTEKTGEYEIFYTALNSDSKILLDFSRLSVCGGEEASKKESLQVFPSLEFPLPLCLQGLAPRRLRGREGSEDENCERAVLSPVSTGFFTCPLSFSLVPTD